jgi:hypothetical protein
MTLYDTGPVGECPACLGTKVVAGVPCQLCKGLGAIGDSGPAPEHQPGLCGFRIGTDCARDWIGAGASEAFRDERITLWLEQGIEGREMDFSDAAPLLTKHGQCAAVCLFPAERRETPRAGLPVMDLSDLPPGGDRERLKVLGVEVHHAAEDDHGSITHVILTGDLSDGTHRECEVRIPESWTQ